MINVFVIQPIFDFLFVYSVKLLSLIFVNVLSIIYFFLNVFEEVGILFILIFTVNRSFILGLKDGRFEDDVEHSTRVALVHCLAHCFVYSSQADNTHKSVSSFDTVYWMSKKTTHQYCISVSILIH